MRPLLLSLGVFLLCSGVARAEYPDREVDRPLLIAPGLSEVTVSAEYAAARRFFDEDGRETDLPEGAARSAITATALARYGVFQGLEVFASAPWLVRLQSEGRDDLSGSGRAALGAGYEVSPQPFLFLAARGALVLPSTARRLRTDDAGVVHHDHLAVAGAIHYKQALLDSSATHGSFEIVFPFANAEDQEIRRDPPSTLRFTAGSTFQVQQNLFVDAAASFTRTNRDRIAGGIVPRSDQFRADVRPSVGLHVLPQGDLLVTLVLPVAGRNTPRAASAIAAARLRF